MGLSSLSLYPWNLLALTTAVPHFSPSLFCSVPTFSHFWTFLLFQCIISMPLIMRQTQAVVFNRLCWKWRQAGTCTSPSRQSAAGGAQCCSACHPAHCCPAPELALPWPHCPLTFLLLSFQLGMCFPDTEVSHKCLSLVHVLVLVPQKVKSLLWKTNYWGISQRSS